MPQSWLQIILIHSAFVTVCTPLGFVRLFGVVGQVLVKPQLMRDVDEKYHAFYLEEASVKRKIDNLQNDAKANSVTASTSSSSSSSSFLKYCDINSIPKNFGSIADTLLKHRSNGHNRTNKFYNTVEVDKLYERLRELKSERKELDKLRSSSAFQRNLVYPLAMLALLALTGFTILMVVQNTLELLIGIKALPLSTRVSIQTVRIESSVYLSSQKRSHIKDQWKKKSNFPQKFTLGITSLSKLGPIGAAIEVLIILYLAATSAVGLYTMPFMQSIRPQRQKTSLSQLIVNGALVVILSSALPLLSRILGEFRVPMMAMMPPEQFTKFQIAFYISIDRNNQFRFAGRLWWNRMVGQFPDCAHVQFDIRRNDHTVSG